MASPRGRKLKLMEAGKTSLKYIGTLAYSTITTCLKSGVGTKPADSTTNLFNFINQNYRVEIGKTVWARNCESDGLNLSDLYQPRQPLGGRALGFFGRTRIAKTGTARRAGAADTKV